VSGNGSSSFGGALRLLAGSALIDDSTIAGNSNGDGAGGAISTAGDSDLTITDSTFTNNSSAGSGGALDAGGGVVIVNSTFANNSSNAPGGALVVSPLAGVTIVASTFDANTAAPQFPGSAVSVGDGGELSFQSTVLARAVDTFNQICVVAQNGTINNDGYNISADSSCGFGTSTGASGQAIGDGVDPLLDPAGVQDNGGPTQTIALLDDSPAIAAIPPSACTDAGGEPLTTDQRGEPRPRSRPCDIGAYETQD
jgi:predicted outer membrane repeat protein